MNTNDNIHTNAGEYTIVALIGEQAYTDDAHNLAIGRAADGHHDILVEDNASVWVLGNEDDVDCNAGMFAALGGSRDTDMDGPNLRNEIADGVRILRDNLDDIRAIDAGIADWIADRADEAANW